MFKLIDVYLKLNFLKNEECCQKIVFNTFDLFYNLIITFLTSSELAK